MSFAESDQESTQYTLFPLASFEAWERRHALPPQALPISTMMPWPAFFFARSYSCLASKTSIQALALLYNSLNQPGKTRTLSPSARRRNHIRGWIPCIHSIDSDTY